MIEQVLAVLLILGLVVITLIPRISFLKNWQKLLVKQKIVCPSGKQVYYSVEQARKSQERLLLEKDQKLRYYQCPQCTYWHLTHKSRHERARHRQEKVKLQKRRDQGLGDIPTDKSLKALKDKYNSPR